MSSGLNTFFSGTVGPQGDRPGPNSVATRLAMYVFLALFFPVLIAVYLGWLALFTYARTPWWVPLTSGLALLLGGAAFGAVDADAFGGMFSGYGNIWEDVSKGVDVFAAIGGNIGAILFGQLWLGLVFGTLVAGVVTAWKYVRRPSHSEKLLNPGPVLWARWRKTAEKIAKGVDSPKSGITLGIAQDRRHPWYAGGKAGERFGERIVLTEAELSTHTLVVGASGGGKTQAMLSGIRDVIRQGHGMVFVDCKGDNEVAEQISDWAARYGREFVHWSIFDGKTQDYDGPANSPAFYDPISRGDPSRRKDLIMGSFLWESPYYKNIIENFLQLLFRIQDLVPAIEGTDNLSDTAHLLDPEALVRRGSNIPADKHPDLAQALHRASSLGPQERSGIASMWSRINTITASTAGQWLRKDPNGDNDIDLARAAHEGQVIVFSLPGNMYPELAGLIAGLVIQDLKTVSSELLNDLPPKPFHVYVDEFGVIDSTNILGLLQRARASKMPCTIATQSLADLATNNHAFPKQVIDTVSLFQIHRVNGEEDARIFAGVSGLIKKTIERLAIENTTGILGAVGATTATGSGYAEEREEYSIPVGAFQSLHELEGILISKGSHRYINNYYVIPEDARIEKVKGRLVAKRGRNKLLDSQRDPGLKVDRQKRRTAKVAEVETYAHPTLVNLSDVLGTNEQPFADFVKPAPNKPAPTAAPQPATSPASPATSGENAGPKRPQRPGAASPAPAAGAPIPIPTAPMKPKVEQPAPKQDEPPVIPVEETFGPDVFLAPPSAAPFSPNNFRQNPEEWNGIP